MVGDMLGSTEVPLVSQAGDLLSAGISAADGDYAMAGLSVAAAIAPGLSQVKLTRTVVKNTDKAIVIGEGMTRVKQAGRTLGAKWYQAWSKFFPKTRQMTKSELDAAMSRNSRWLESKIRKGYKIYDIGTDNLRPDRSPFYELEREILRKHNYPTIPIFGY